MCVCSVNVCETQCECGVGVCVPDFCAWQLANFRDSSVPPGTCMARSVRQIARHIKNITHQRLGARSDVHGPLYIYMQHPTHTHSRIKVLYMINICYCYSFIPPPPPASSLRSRHEANKGYAGTRYTTILHETKPPGRLPSPASFHSRRGRHPTQVRPCWVSCLLYLRLKTLPPGPPPPALRALGLLAAIDGAGGRTYAL